MVNLSEKQIYKWGYEKRRRLNLSIPHDTSIDMKYITQIGELAKPIDFSDLNKLVSELFPEETNEEESLSEEARVVYDYLRDQLIERSVEYDKQSDLEKLLNERIPITNLAVEAKKNLMHCQANSSDRKMKEHCWLSENNLKSQISILGSTQITSIQDPEEWSEKSLFVQYEKDCSVDYDARYDQISLNQIDSENNQSVENSMKNKSLRVQSTIIDEISLCKKFTNPGLETNEFFSDPTYMPKDTFSSTPITLCLNPLLDVNDAPLHEF
eukprot:CAMPEP_0196995688 /NCGR_PEP_ID=MMETSP1380-20130617/1761_1 /TAXON_ID=5936 /ORGANISM="Euplotes crassus, Strain CT5" /LENGTH=268 /DNA_ID=CAMNT_0042411443 /DNA_START=324 /DNA_END=1130 /DNA_ORIENTATION=-